MSRREKKEEDSGLGSFLKAGAVVAGAAAVAYGAYKLFDIFGSLQAPEAAAGATGGQERPETVYKKCCESDSDDGDSPRDSPLVEQRDGGMGYNQLGSHVRSSDASPPGNASKGKMTLVEQLMSYYTEYVEIYPAERKDAQRVVKEIKVLVASKIKAMEGLVSEDPIDLVDFGMAAESLNVICSQEFEFLVPVKLEKSSWNVQNGGRPGSILVTSNNSSIPAEMCDEGGNFSPILLADVVRKAVGKAISFCTRYEFNMNSDGSSIVLDVTYTEQRKFLRIIFRPAIIIGDDLFIPCPADADNHWQRTYIRQENCCMERFGPSVTCHRTVLKIFLAISLNWPSYFGVLNSNHYKTILFRLLDEQPESLDWTDSTIPEHFIDFLIELGNCLKSQSLPHHFEPDVNLFEDLPPESMEKFASFVNKLVGQQDFADLLKRDYDGKRN